MDEKKDDTEATTVPPVVNDVQAPKVEALTDATDAEKAPTRIDVAQLAAEEEAINTPLTPGSAISPTPLTIEKSPEATPIVAESKEEPEVAEEPEAVVEHPETDSEEESEPPQDVPTPTENPMAIPSQPVKKSGSPKIVIFVAVLVALGLGSASVFAYMKMQKTEKTTTDSSKITTPNKVEEPKVTDKDVEAAEKDVDDQFKTTDDAKDIPSSESINDQTLGL